MKQIVLLIGFIGAVLVSCNTNENISVYCIGDSTTANKKEKVFPEHG